VTSNHLFIIELIGFSGIALGVAFWELWSLRRDKKKAERARTAADLGGAGGAD